jgi:hypothetical protein
MNTQLQGRAAHGKTRIHALQSRNNTGIAGVTETHKRNGKALVHCFVVSPHRRRFNIKTLGREEAFRRAVALRAKHEAEVRAKKGGAL